MKLSEMIPGQMTKMDKLVILALNDKDFLFVLPGHKIKRTSDTTLDLDLPEATKEEMKNALNGVEHNSDWMSLMHAELIKTKFLN